MGPLEILAPAGGLLALLTVIPALLEFFCRQNDLPTHTHVSFLK